MKNLDFLNKLKLDNKKITLIVICGIFIFYLDYNYIIKAQIKNVNTIKPNIEKVKNEINTLNKELSELDDLKGKQIKPDALRKRIITSEEIPALLEKISDLANKNKVRINRIAPSREAKKEEKEKSASKFPATTIALDILGSYHDLGSFINELENSDIFIVVEEIRIKRVTNDYLKESATLLLKTYVRK